MNQIMKRIVSVLLMMILCATPVMAQDSFSPSVKITNGDNEIKVEVSGDNDAFLMTNKPYLEVDCSFAKADVVNEDGAKVDFTLDAESEKIKFQVASGGTYTISAVVVSDNAEGNTTNTSSGRGGGSSTSVKVDDDKVTIDTSSSSISEKNAEKAIDKAAENDVDEIVIDTNKNKVTLPAGMIEDIVEKTDAELVIETKNGSVTIPRDVLEKLDVEGKVTITVTDDKVTIIDENGEIIIDDTDEEIAPVAPVEPEIPAEHPFKDVKADDWFAPAVQYVYENGLMSGVDEDNFGPYWNTTRGMITTILWRMEGKPAAGAVPFTDVNADMYYADAIAWAAENGIVSGYDAVTFGPEDNITREQLASILWRYAKYKGYDISVGEDTNILSYEDAFSISEYAILAMQWVCGAGIISGNDDGTLNPAGYAQRAHAAQMLMKFMKNTAE